MALVRASDRQCVFTQGLLKGLSFLHDREPIILHRDLKPGNLLLADGLRTLKIAGHFFYFYFPSFSFFRYFFPRRSQICLVSFIACLSVWRCACFFLTHSLHTSVPPSLPPFLPSAFYSPSLSVRLSLSLHS